MLRELIIWVLNTYLGNYLEDFNPAQLSVALLSGEVELENVPIRKDALRSLGIPVQVLSGIIGKIKLQIPVRQFRTAPWCVVIEQVYAVISPKNSNDWNYEEEHKFDFDFKISALNSNESIWKAQKDYHNESFYYSTSYTNWLTYGTSLVTNIVENLELQINQVHLRYEDFLTIPGFDFAAGVRIDSLNVQSCDCKWISGSKSSQNEEIAYKLIELKNLAIYIDQITANNSCSNLKSKELLQSMEALCNCNDHKYVLNPISASAHCKRERCKLPLCTRSRPRLSCHVVVSKADISLSDQQYKRIIGCYTGLKNVLNIRSFKMMRPMTSISENAGDWWRYAAQCHGYKFETKVEKLKKIKENLRYIRIYKNFLINPNENVLKEEKQFRAYMERIRTLKELNVLRQVCYDSITPNRNIESPNITEESMLFHWFPNWWGWYGDSSADLINTHQQYVAEDEQYLNIEDATLNGDTIGNNTYLKRDLVFGLFDIELAGGELFIYAENSTTSTFKTMIEISFQTLNLMIETRPRSDSHLICLSMGSVHVKDRITPGSEFPDLIKPQIKEFTVLPHPSFCNINFKEKFKPTIDTENMEVFDPWFQLQYEKRPVCYNSDFRLLIKSKSLDIVYNTVAVQWIVDFFTYPLSGLNAKNRLNDRQRAVNAVFFKNWRQILGNLERKTWTFEIDIAAPRIIFVDNFCDKNASVVLIDFGRFQLLKGDTESRLKHSKTKAGIKMEVKRLNSDYESDDDNDMYLTPCSTPPVSATSPSGSPTLCFTTFDTSKVVINDHTGFESYFHNKIYDKYIIDMTDLQVIICKSNEGSFGNFRGSSVFNLLDKFSISLELERRIINTSDPDYPSFTLYGTLPKLVVHLKDQYIKLVSEVISLFSTAKKHESNKQEKEKVSSQIKKESDIEESDKKLSTNLIVIQFLVDQMTLELQSQQRSIAELQVIGVRAGLRKKPDETEIDLSVLGLLLVDGIQSFGPDFELLVASHRHIGMDSISGSLKESNQCSPTSPISQDSVIYKGLISSYIISKAINSIKTDNSNIFTYPESIEPLITVDMHFVNGDNENKNALQFSNVHFNNLDIIANPETIAELIGFINSVKSIYKHKRKHKRETVETDNEINPEFQQNISVNSFHLQTEISFNFQRLNVLILRTIRKENVLAGRKIGTFTMSEAKIHASLGREINITGSLGGLQVLDVTPEGSKHQRIFSFGKDPIYDASNFKHQDFLSSHTQEMYGHSNVNQQDALLFKVLRNEDCIINVRMASVWYTHSARFIQEISWCAKQFTHYIKSLARSIRNKATDMAIELVQQRLDKTKSVDDLRTNRQPKSCNNKEEILGSNCRIKLDLLLNSPVLVLPRSSKSSEVLVANLGKISICNVEEQGTHTAKLNSDFTKVNDKYATGYRYLIDIVNINLFSLDNSHRKELRLSDYLPKSEELYSCEKDAIAILHDTAFKIELSNVYERFINDTATHGAEFLSIDGKVTKLLKVSLLRGQYEQLLDSLNNAFRTQSEIITPFTCIPSGFENPNGSGTIINEKNDFVKQCDEKTNSMCKNISFSLPLLVISLKNDQNNPLVEINFHEFSVKYSRQSEIHTSLEVLLKSIFVEDLQCKVDSKFRRMVDSAPCNEAKISKKRHISSYNLTKIDNTSLMSRSMPEDLNYLGCIQNGNQLDDYINYSTQSFFEGICHTSAENQLKAKTDTNLITYIMNIISPDVIDTKSIPLVKSSADFNSLNLIICIEKWFMVLDFFGLFSSNENVLKNSQYLKPEHFDHTSTENFETHIYVRSLSLIFVRRDSELAKANVSHVNFKIKREIEINTVEGRFGSLSLFDLTGFGKFYREKFVTSGNEALNFCYKRSNPVKKKCLLDTDATLRIEMSSVRYVHTNRFLMEINSFLSEFLEIKTHVVNQIKHSHASAVIDDQPIQIGLEIRAASLIILLPIYYESNDLIIADLGEFTLINSFHLTSEDKSKKISNIIVNNIIDVMQINLLNINLFAGKRLTKLNEFNGIHHFNQCLNFGSFYVAKFGENLFEKKCFLNLQLKRNLNTNSKIDIPDVSVNGTMSKVTCILNLQQYKLIRGFLTYNLGENTEDIFCNPTFKLSESVDKINTTCKINFHTNETNTCNVLSIKIDFDDVSVHLNFQEENCLGYTSLACITFIKSVLKIDYYNDGARDIDFISSEILINDSRYQPIKSNKVQSNIFTEILKPIRNQLTNITQAEVHSRSRDNCNRFTILLNNMRIIAIFDWMKSVNDYISEHIEPPSIGIKMCYNRSNLENKDINSTFEIVCNVTDSELVFVDKNNQFDTSAIILKSTMVISYKPLYCKHPLSVNIGHLEVFSCSFEYETDSALSIIDPVSLSLELKNNELSVFLQKQLFIRLSYHDVKLFSKLLQSISVYTSSMNVTKLTKTHTYTDFELIAPLIAMGFKPLECFNAMEINNNKINDAAMWLSQQKQYKFNRKSLQIHSVNLTANCISVCVIDDCKDSDVPILEILLSPFMLSLKLKESNETFQNDFGFISGKLEATITGEYYNRCLSGWESVIEPWQCIISWKYKEDKYSNHNDSNYNNTFIDLEVISKQLLKLNITSTFIELCKLVRNNWIQDYYEGVTHTNDYRLRTPFLPFALKNQTGELLQFKTIFGQPGGITRMDVVQRDLVNDWIKVKPNETVPFTFGPQNKLRHLDSHKFNIHQILVAVTGWTVVGPISIDKVGVFFRYSTEEQLLKRDRIVFDITLMGSAQKLITVRSALRVYNNLSISALLGMEKNEHSYIIKPKEFFNVPLKGINSLIYIKPYYTVTEQDTKDNKAVTQFEFCRNGLSWTNCVNDMQELSLFCNQDDITFNVLAVIKRDKFPHRDILHMPGHTISLITPLIITNLLCTDIIFKIAGHTEGRIHSSECANIYNINIYDALNISFTLDNYSISGELRIPTKHSGVVEPKLKLIDTNNRNLYLLASIQCMKGKGMEIFISAPVWIINKTFFPLIYKQEGVDDLASGQFEEHEKGRSIMPLMFSFSDPDAPSSIEIRLGNRFGQNNPWCKSFNLHKDIIYRQLQEEDGKGSYEIGIDIQRGRGMYSCTNIVTLSPRFQLYNRSSHILQFAQKCDILKDENCIKLFKTTSGCHFPFHWPNRNEEHLLCVRLLNVEYCHWSNGIPINKVQSIYINVRNHYGAMFFLRLEVILHGSTNYLLFSDAYTLPPPIRIDNYSEVQVNFFQYKCKPQWRTTVKPHSSLSYALDNPVGNRSLQIEAPGGNSINLPLHKLESSRSITYSNFIYIAFKETFVMTQKSENIYKHSEVDIEKQNLVLGVKDKKVILMKKCAGDRSQLWRMNSSGQLEHEGTSPPIEQGKLVVTSDSRMVLDLEKPPNPMDYTNLVIRPPNKQRETTQTWRFEHGRLMCHANMCVQTRNGVFGLYPGSEAVLGRMDSEGRIFNKNWIPIEQCIERQKLRRGSGHLELISRMDGPIFTIQIRDIKIKLEDESLLPDPLWKHTSTIVRRNLETVSENVSNDCTIKLELDKGIGVSIISCSPCEELIYLTLQYVAVEYLSTSLTKSLCFKIDDIQIDNQLLDTFCPVLLYTSKSSNNNCHALEVNAKMLKSLNENAIIIENITVHFISYTVILEERLILKLALFLGFKKGNLITRAIELECDADNFTGEILSTSSRRYYFENLYIGPCQIRLSVCTATKLSPQLYEVKKALGLTLIKFEDALIDFDKFSERHHFETMDVYLTVIKLHYKNQIKWHAASILGSVDFLGNPLGLASDLSEGVSCLIFEGSVKSLVRNIAHGISNSTAKLTETLSDGLGRVVLDETDNEARQKILETSFSNTSAEHISAGLKGFGFGLLGGITSIVRHTYAGFQNDGLNGFITGFGKGLVGTVTKPIIGVLDLASETATAVRETSRGANRAVPERKRWPRCVNGASGGLLPPYSYRQSRGQQYLYMINRKNLTEHLIFYEPNLCNDRDAKLRLLVSTEYIRIFSRCEEDPAIVLDCHLSEILSCHTLTANNGSIEVMAKSKPLYYIEISTNLPKITRPRIRCQNGEIAERASRYINYAKTVYDEKEQTVTSE